MPKVEEISLKSIQTVIMKCFKENSSAQFTWHPHLKMKTFFSTLVLILLGSWTQVVTAEQDESHVNMRPLLSKPVSGDPLVHHKEIESKADVLFQDYFEWKFRKMPQEAIFLGLHEYSIEDELNDFSLNTALQISKECKIFEKRAMSILDDEFLDDRTRYYVAVLHTETKYCIDGFLSKGYLLPPISFLNGVQVVLAMMFRDDNILQLETLNDYKNALTRLKKIPKQLNEIIMVLKEGIKENVTHAKESILRTKLQFDRLQVRPEASDFYVQFKKMPQKLHSKVDESELKMVQSNAKKTIKNLVLPAFKKLGDFIHGEYFDHTRPHPGISSLPLGQEFYERCLKFHTTLSDISPEEVHNIGLDEVAELRKKMMETAKELGFDDTITFEEFISSMEEDPSQYFASKNETLDYFEQTLAQINPKLTQIFDTDVLIDEVYNLDVKPVPPGKGGLAYYISSSIDGKRQGAFFINLDNIKAIKKFQTMSLTLHEGNPGHHLQITNLNRNVYLPHFIKFRTAFWSVPSSTPWNTAFTEGWALYSEFLGNELGLFEDLNQRVGFYSWNLLRACRLVVDTGIHAFAWSRQEAIDYLKKNTGLDQSLCEQQVDRYITWPGQAAAYKMGERKILEMRRSREADEGDEFDLKAFHKRMLSCISTLDMVDACVRMEEVSVDLPKRIYGSKPRKPKFHGTLSAASSFFSHSHMLLSILIATLFKISLWKIDLK